MSNVSSIEWTDATWNPVRGCTKVSPGCANCYAESFAERWRGVPNHPYTQGFDLRLVPEKLDAPLTWKTPLRIFVNSMSDLFQDDVPHDFILRVFETMEKAHWHTFQLLTKRPARMLDFLGGSSGAGLSAPPLPNVWLGVSVENQHFADERIPLLLQTPAAVRFISAEPLLGPIDLTRVRHRVGSQSFETASVLQGDDEFSQNAVRNSLDWVIVGGESGGHARTFNIKWARSIVRQCQQADVPVFVKQLGQHTVSDEPVPMNDAGFPEEDGPAQAGQRLLLSKKGGVMAEWPLDLQVREFPNCLTVAR